MRVRVRGTIYETVKEAADANGVTTDAVYRAIRNGDPDKIGSYKKRKNTKTPEQKAKAAEASRKPIRIADVYFPSRKALGETVGMTQKAIREAINGGGFKAMMNLEERVRKATSVFNEKT